MIDYIDPLNADNDILLNSQDLSKRVSYLMKTIQDNDVIDYTDATYDENETELS